MFDIAIIGGGVVGCAILREMTLCGHKALLVERAPDLLDGASKANSAILHTGFDAPVGSLEQRLVADGYSAYRDIHERLGLPLRKTGALVLAWSEEDESRLPGLLQDARDNGVDNATVLSRAEILDREPSLSSDVRAGLHIPDEAIIDPWSAPLAYATQAIDNGGTIMRDAEVLSGSYDGAQWQLETSKGSISARFVVNAAGLHGDRIDRMLRGTADFTIKPRKGQFVVLDKSASQDVRSILLPVPNQTTKGIVVCPTIYGNVLIGPTAEEQEDRDHAEMDEATLRGLRAHGAKLVPNLAHHGVTAVYAGLRPATETKDYRIEFHQDVALLTLGGIRSTGLSAALGIARHAVTLLAEAGLTAVTKTDVSWPKVANISEDGPRDWSKAGHGGIVCHCELVTRREIEAALTGPLGARSMAGLKRRTRAMMGRCQGFYCAGEVSRLFEEGCNACAAEAQDA